jgi:hypothetical protein
MCKHYAASMMREIDGLKVENVTATLPIRNANGVCDGSVSRENHRTAHRAVARNRKGIEL